MKRLIGILLLGCSPALYGQTDDFPERLKLGCAMKQRCHILITEAEARVARCEPNTLGRLRCSDTNADLRIAQGFLRRIELAEEETEKADHEARAREREQRAQAERDRVVAQAEATERQRVADRERQQRERDELEFERRQAAEEKLALEIERLRLLGAGGRQKELQACYREYDDRACRELLSRLLSASEAEPEKRSLVQLDQRLSTAPAESSGSNSSATSGSSANSGSGRVRCNDGTLSPSCRCDRASLRGCCSHHGGVAGCD